MNRQRTSHRFPRAFRNAVAVALACGVLAAIPPPAAADSFADYLLAVAGIRLGTLEGTYTLKEEDQLIKTAYMQYKQQQKNGGFNLFGQAEINGAYPDVLLGTGANSVLTFQFVDSTNALPTAGPAVSAVLYQANLDPNNPSSLVTLGTSMDATSDFSLPFTLTGQEPLILATPEGPTGAPVVVSGVAGQNIAVGAAVALNAGTVPEASTESLLGMGLLVLLGVVPVRRRWRMTATGSTNHS